MNSNTMTAGIKQAVENFARGAADLDFDLMEQTLDANFRAHVTFGDSGEFMVMNKEQYLGAMKAGKVGGQPVDVDFREFEQDGTIATLRADLTSPVLKMESHYSLIQTAGQWRVSQSLVRALKL